jgi:hypothetical protein
MPTFPPAPVAPTELMQEYLPAAFAELGSLEGAADLDLALGLKLEGAGGGEWVVRLCEGRVDVRAVSRDHAAFTVLQSVDDWRGALWEGRGGVAGKALTRFFRPQAPPADAVERAALDAPKALARVRGLEGRVRLCVTGGPGGDWAVDLMLGPGRIPRDATTTVTIDHDDAEALGQGDLDPMQAFMGGRIGVSGSVSLLVRLGLGAS